MAEPVLSCKGLTFRYRSEDAPVFSNLSLTVSRGEAVLLMGPSGCGKSTLARHINALLQPTEGVMGVFGMDTKDESKTLEIRKRAGMIFQNPDNQIVASVVEEDVAFGPENLGVPTEEIRKRVDQALAQTGMTSFAKRAPHTLSGGQKQRVGIAGVLAMQPQLIILDEPTSMLDPSGREAVMQTLDELHESGITLIHITHSMDEALKAQRMIVMDAGRIVLDSTPEEIFTNHADELVSWGLELPMLMETAYECRQCGLDVGAGLSMEEMVEQICQL